MKNSKNIVYLLITLGLSVGLYKHFINDKPSQALYPLMMMSAIDLAIEDKWYPSNPQDWLKDWKKFDEGDKPFIIEFSDEINNQYTVKGQLYYHSKKDNILQCKDMYFSFVLNKETMEPMDKKLIYAKECE